MARYASSVLGQAAITLGLALLLAGCYLPPAMQQGEEDTSTVSASRRAAILDSLDKGVRQNFGHWEAIPDFHYSEKFAAFKAKALPEADRIKFDFLMMAWMASLKNGHTHFTDKWLDRELGAAMPFDFYDLDGRWVVTSSAVPGLQAGTTLAKIDQRPIDDWFHEKEIYIDASSERERRTMFADTALLFPLRFTVTTASGQQVAIDRTTQKPAPKEISHRWLVSHSVGYIRIPTFESEESDGGVVRLIEQYRSADAIIVDVRKNKGGYPPVHLISAFFHGPWPWWQVRNGRGSNSSAQVTEEVRRGSGDLAYSGAVIVLADRRCASSCEDLVMALKAAKRGTVIGETTLGSSDVPIFLDFGNGMSARIGFERYRMPDGSPFEGVGIPPDIEIPWRAEDLLAGRDPALAKAVQLAKASSR